MTALVILPGLDGTATMHAAFVEAARKWFDPISVVNYPTGKALNYAELETLVRASLPRERFVLLGESFSGPIALSIATESPSNLVGLILSTTFARSPAPWLSLFAPLIRIAPIRAIPSSILSWLLLGRWATEQVKAELQGALSAVSPAVLRARALTTLGVDVSSKLGKISVPALCLRATKDRLLSRAAVDRITSAIPRAAIVEVEGPHLLLQAAPLVCAEAVGNFAKSL